jgi:hypothetical protein
MTDADWNEVGFTGPKSGMTHDQRDTLRGLLVARYLPVTRNQPKVNRNVFHHGSCVGSDDLAGWVAHRVNYYVVVHPPKIDKFRSYSYYDRLEAEEDYLVRDRRIVDESSFIFSTPSHPEPKSLRGDGTWYTLNYAFGAEKPGVIIWPNGDVENFDQYRLRILQGS